MGLQAVLDLPFRCWLSETGEVLISLGQYVDIMEKRLPKSREQDCDRTDSIRGRGGDLIEEKLENENGFAEGRIRDSLSENSEENFELFEGDSELVITVCRRQDEAMKNFQNVIDMLHLSEEQAEQLGLSLMGEVNREEQVGIRYRLDQRTGQETIVIPIEWLEAKIVSTDFEKDSFEGFVKETGRGKENMCNRVERCKKIDEEMELGYRELQSQAEKRGGNAPP